MAGQFVYLARHGLTVANEAQVVQGFDDPLSERGHRQAKRLAERAKHLSFDHLLASDMPRAVQTAEYITTATGKETIFEPMVREVKQEDSLIGVSKSAAEFQKFLEEEKNNVHNPEWRFGSADTFYDNRDRALKALKIFESYGEAKLFVVSHGHFIRFLVSTVLLDLSLTPEAWIKLCGTIRTHNTGISILRRDTDTGKWVIYSINDHAHFADD